MFVSQITVVPLVMGLFLLGCGGDLGGGNNNVGNGNGNDSGTAGPVCGNGEIEGLEDCDDGAANSDTVADACRSDCTAAFCGDGVVDTGEACDDGSGNSDVVSDQCRTSCVEPDCGDGVVDVGLGESCDEGAALPTEFCGVSCVVIFCGNGLLEGDEQCDDGNVIGADGCSADCMSDEICGNGIVDAAMDETCDDGNTVDGDGCSHLCRAEYCGNGTLDGTELCDDGNGLGGDGCSADCRSDESCGNDIVDVAAGEECDLGGANSDLPDADCRTNCELRRCGDDVLDPSGGEVCDGTQLGGAGCRDYGYYGGALGCSGFCQHDTQGCVGYCGDGLLASTENELCDLVATPGETCLDYGFDTGLLGCSAWCTPGLSGCENIGWQVWPVASTKPLEGIWGSGPNDIWVVGSDAARHFDGSAWTNVDPGATGYMAGVWGTGPSDVFVVGGSGMVRHYDGTAWSGMTSNTGEFLGGVWGTGPGDVFAVGSGGTIIHYDGTDWSPVDVGVEADWYAIWGNHAADIYIAGNEGRIVHFDGQTWKPLASGTTEIIYAIWGDHQSVIFAGEAGYLRELLTTDKGFCYPSEGACFDGWDNDCDGQIDCADPDCVGADAEVCDDGVDNDCDGDTDCGDTDCAGQGACEASEVSCTDGVDNDGDGETDCLDPDCSAQCNTGSCSPAHTISCGVPLTGTNAGAPSVITGYGCLAFAESGPEVSYRFMPTVSGNAVVQLSGVSLMLELVVVGAQASGECNPIGDCIGADTTFFTDIKTVAFPVTAGETYYIIVESRSVALDNYELRLVCD